MGCAHGAGTAVTRVHCLGSFRFLGVHFDFEILLYLELELEMKTVDGIFERWGVRLMPKEVVQVGPISFAM